MEWGGGGVGEEKESGVVRDAGVSPIVRFTGA